MPQNLIFSNPVRDEIKQIVSDCPIVAQAKEISRNIHSDLACFKPDVDIPQPSENDFKAEPTLAERVRQLNVLREIPTARINLKAPPDKTC